MSNARKAAVNGLMSIDKDGCYSNIAVDNAIKYAFVGGCCGLIDKNTLLFNGDLSKWDVSNVQSVEEAFARTNYTQNLDSWNLKNCKNFDKCFDKSPLENNPPKWYKK